MSKSSITTIFIGSTVALITGVIVCIAAVFALFASGAFVLTGPDVTGFNSTPLAWTLIGICLVGCLAIIGGAVGGLIAWIGALLNTAQLEDKTWFVVLLVLGLWCFGFLAMVAYVLAGPDGTQPQLKRAQAPA